MIEDLSKYEGQEFPSTKNNKKPLEVPKISYRTAQEVMDGGSIEYKPRFIIGSLLERGTVTMFSGDPNIGKSPVSVQMGEAAARGWHFFEMMSGRGVPTDEPIYLKLENEFPEGLKVLYLDLELTDDQFVDRYSIIEDKKIIKKYEFHKNFYKPSKKQFLTISNPRVFFETIRVSIKEMSWDLIILDNLTAMFSDMEKADSARDIVQGFKTIAEETNVSFLLVNHPTKPAPGQTVSTGYSARGSGVFLAQVDIMITLCQVPDNPNRVYLRQDKGRTAQKRYSSTNVILMELNRAENGFLGYSFYGYTKELSLKPGAKPAVDEQFEEQRLKYPEKTTREIAKILVPLNPEFSKFNTLYQACLRAEKRLTKKLIDEEVQKVEEEKLNNMFLLGHENNE